MARATRQDAHRPSGMVPGNYRYLGGSYPVGDINPDTGNHIVYPEWDGTEEWEALGRPQQSTCEHAQPGKCDHCGAPHIYQAILLYIPTGEILSVGHTCASQRFGRKDWSNIIADGARRAECKALRAKNEAAAVAKMDAPTLAAYEWAKQAEGAGIARDIAHKVLEYGPLSEKQSAFLVRLHTEALEAAAEAAAHPEVHQPCPEGKVEITGVVLGLKSVPAAYGYGTVEKMIVGDDRGFRVYGTVPTQLWESCLTDGQQLRGSRVVFSATIEPSRDDKEFGFFKRPTKARKLEAVAA